MDKGSRSAGIVKIVVWSVVALILIGLLVGGIVNGSSGIISLGNLTSLGGYVYDDCDSYTVGNTEYSETAQIIDVSWIAGDVRVMTWEGSTVKLEESGAPDEDADKMRSRLENGTLTVKFVKSGRKIWDKNVIEKDLTIYIPASMSESLKRFDVSVASANLTVDDGENKFALNTVDVDSASGKVTVKCHSVSVLDVDTVSGDICLEGSFGEVNIDAASANVSVKGSIDKIELDAVSGKVDIDGSLKRGDIGAVSGNVRINTYDAAPSSLDVETVSGSIELILPTTEEGFVARLESASGTMTCNGTRGRHYKSGSGVSDYDFETVSGDVTITVK